MIFFRADEQIRMGRCVKDCFGGIMSVKLKLDLFSLSCWYIKSSDVRYQIHPMIAPTSCTLEEHFVFFNLYDLESWTQVLKYLQRNTSTDLNWVGFRLSFLINKASTLPKTNIAPKNGWLEY